MMTPRTFPACLVALWLSIALIACGGPDKPAGHDPVDPPPGPPNAPISNRPIEDDPGSATLRLLDERLNSARLAAGKVATMPSVSDARARQEILLHASMYRAAYETRVARSTQHFVLDPMREDYPPDIGMEPEEFRLRVLGSLDDLDAPMAWVTETWRRTGVDRFPAPEGEGAGEPRPLATRLRITIFSRDESTGVVRGEVGDWTAGGGASRQGVTCRWDGLTWQIERDPVRMTW